VLGAIAAGAAEMEPAAPQAPLPTIRAGQGQPRVFVPIQRTAHVPFTAEHQPTVALRGTPTFALNPTFKAMVASERGLRINTGRVARAAIYRVASGDSLYLIAKRLLGNGARWRELYSANRGKIASPSLLRIGMTLSLPGSALPPLGDTYQVARGDSLYVIAARRLKNANRWREIATLNADRLKGSTMIYPNQVLLLPNV
jgi:nucleoid-associated protein YgaU